MTTLYVLEVREQGVDTLTRRVETTNIFNIHAYIMDYDHVLPNAHLIAVGAQYALEADYSEVRITMQNGYYLRVTNEGVHFG